MFKSGDALLIVDAQNDFFPGGALPVPEGDKIVPVINNWIKTAEKNQLPIIFSRDWHPKNHCSFQAQGGSWPSHCVQNSQGAEIHPEIYFPAASILVNKGEEPDKDAYSAFKAKTKQGVTLDFILNQHSIKRIWLCGLAQDFCVLETALDARKFGYEVKLILEGTKSITEESGQLALAKMQAAGVDLHKG